MVDIVENVSVDQTSYDKVSKEMAMLHRVVVQKPIFRKAALQEIENGIIDIAFTDEDAEIPKVLITPEVMVSVEQKAAIEVMVQEMVDQVPEGDGIFIPAMGDVYDIIVAKKHTLDEKVEEQQVLDHASI